MGGVAHLCLASTVRVVSRPVIWLVASSFSTWISHFVNTSYKISRFAIVPPARAARPCRPYRPAPARDHWPFVYIVLLQLCGSACIWGQSFYLYLNELISTIVLCKSVGYFCEDLNSRSLRIRNCYWNLIFSVTGEKKIVCHMLHNNHGQTKLT